MKRNIISTLILNIVTILSGIILPRLFILEYNSDINGAIVSISQFLSYITFLEAGVGVVVSAALYKPLVENNIGEINYVIAEAEQFYKRVALIYLIYMLVVGGIYPFIVPQFDWKYTFALVLVIGASTFCQYYFGLSYQLLLDADGKIWINAIFNIIAIVYNMMISIVLIYQNVDILIVKLACSVIYIVRPIILKGYVKRRYRIGAIKLSETRVLKQKWHGLGHHIASFLHLNTDVVLMTFFLPISEVSVYSVYASISISIRSIVKGVSEGVVATLGQLLAKGEIKKIRKFFDAYILLNIIVVSILFTVSGMLICPFVSLYIPKVANIDYLREDFAVILFMAEAVYCFRLPYQDVVFSSGHFMQTQKSAYVEAVINVILTIPFLKYYGILGAVIGTFIATLFRLFSYIYYLSKEIIYIKGGAILSRYFANIFLCILGVCLLKGLGLTYKSWIEWIMNGVVIFTFMCGVILLGNYLFFRREMQEIYSMFTKKRRKNS